MKIFVFLINFARWWALLAEGQKAKLTKSIFCPFASIEHTLQKTKRKTCPKNIMKKKK